MVFRSCFVSHSTAFPSPPTQRTQMSEPTIGHNSEAESAATKFSKDQLRSIIERIERMEEEKKDNLRRHQGHLCRGQGQRLRRQGASHHRAHAQAGSQRARRAETILETYMHALGML
jgi:uncharacterized protein (UPF0335 family)